MTDSKRIFDRFNPHAYCEIIEYDGSKTPSLLVRDIDGRRVRHPMQTGLPLQASTLQKGRTVGVQFGKLSLPGRNPKATSNEDHGIVAIQHLVPRTDVLTMAIIRACAIDPDETLRQYVEGANTRVLKGFETGIDPCSRERMTLDYMIRGGRLFVTADLGGDACISGGRISVPGSLPETVTSAMIGQRVASLIAHPVLIDPRIVITGVEHIGGDDVPQRLNVSIDSPIVDLAHHGEQTNLPFAA